MTNGTMLEHQPANVNQREATNPILPNAFAAEVLMTCLDQYGDDSLAASDYLRERVARLNARLEQEVASASSAEGVRKVRGMMLEVTTALTATSGMIEQTGSTAFGIQYYLMNRVAQASPYTPDDWAQYERQHRLFENTDITNDIVVPPETSETDQDEVLVPEIMPAMEFASFDEHGFPVPEWGSKIPLTVDEIRWQPAPAKDVEIRFNNTEIPAVPLGQLATYHGARRTHTLKDPRGRSEAGHLLAQLPKAIANLVGSRAVLVGLFMQDHGLSKAEVNQDLADRLHTQWVATAEAQRGVRPDTGLRSAGRIKNTSYRPVGGTSVPKQLDCTHAKGDTQ